MYKKIINSRVLSIVCIIFVYILSFALGFFSSIFIKDNDLLKLFFADVVATIICFIFSLIFKNTSVYDPYWSVAPIFIALYFFIKYKSFNPTSIVLFSVLSIWGIRLTINWYTTFPNLTHEDYRYSLYRNKLNKFMFFFVNFFGLHMVPTLVVYVSLIPLLILFMQDSVSLLSLLGAGIIVVGILLEIFADRDMHEFLRNTKEKVSCKNGLWNYSRHPNYLGENLIWIGVAVALICSFPNLWYMDLGFIFMILLFEFISIPLAEKHHLSRRSDYPEYIKSTSRMLLLPHKHR